MYASTKAISTLILVSFSNGLQISIFYSTLWPYSNSIDPTISVTFFGIITAAFSIGQGISSVAFGYWMDSVQSARCPLLCSLFLMSLSNILYCLAQITSPINGKIIILLSRIILGLGAGSISVTRALAPNVGRHSTRNIALVQCAYSFGTVLQCTVGPLLQFILTLLGSPLPGINLYTAGPLILTIVNFLVLIPVNLFMDDAMTKRKTTITSDFGSYQPQYFGQKRDNFILGMVITTIFIVMLIGANVDSILSAYAELMWNWRNEQTVRYLGYFHSLHGVTQIIVYLLISSVLTEQIGSRAILGTIFGLVLAILFFFLTYPYSFFGEILSCQTYSWCSSTHGVNVFLFAFAFSVVLATCYPLIGISTNLIFCDSIDASKQGFLMGILTSVANIGKILGPILVTFIFDNFGPKIIWISMLVFISGICGFWTSHWRRRKTVIGDIY